MTNKIIQSENNCLFFLRKAFWVGGGGFEKEMADSESAKSPPSSLSIIHSVPRSLLTLLYLCRLVLFQSTRRNRRVLDKSPVSVFTIIYFEYFNAVLVMISEIVHGAVINSLHFIHKAWIPVRSQREKISTCSWLMKLGHCSNWQCNYLYTFNNIILNV